MLNNIKCEICSKETENKHFCSYKCYFEAMKSGKSTGGFKVGYLPWNKGKYGIDLNNKGHAPWNKGLTKETSELVKEISIKQMKFYSHHYKEINCLECNKAIYTTNLYRKFCSHSCANRYHDRYSGVWNRGLTKETDKRVLEISKKVSKYRMGRPHSEETRKKLIGHLNHNFNGYGRGGFRKDLSCYFRSSWEANLARIFNYLKISWKYEEHRICFEDGSILLDFWLPEKLFDIEVKGWDRDSKLKKLFISYPNYPIKIVDGETYKKLISMFKDKIPAWEK